MNPHDDFARTDIDPVAYYRRIRFGKASEALVGEQRLLFEETVDMDLAAIEEELETQTPAKRQPKRAARQPLPPELLRMEQRHAPESCQCGHCGADLVKIGEDISEQLAGAFLCPSSHPSAVACRPCQTMTAAPIPPAVIDGVQSLMSAKVEQKRRKPRRLVNPAVQAGIKCDILLRRQFVPIALTDVGKLVFHDNPPFAIFL